MSQSATVISGLPPEVVDYIKGATEECLQFDFLIGDWKVDGNRYGPEGEIQHKYTGKWHAQYLHDKRMVMDDFTVFLASNEAASTFVTLRTYSPQTKRWEMSGLAAFQPAALGNWHGYFINGEMHLSAEGRSPAGQRVLSKIRFYEITPQHFQWENRLSFDNGETWLKVGSLHARKV